MPPRMMTGESRAQKPSFTATAIFFALFFMDTPMGTFSTTAWLFLRRSVPERLHMMIFAATKITPMRIPGRIPARNSLGIDTLVDAP